jgi:hypothetical protein
MIEVIVSKKFIRIFWHLFATLDAACLSGSRKMG